MAIAYDSRLCSRDFAYVTAGVLAKKGLRALVYGSLMPTPMLSFAVRTLGCDAGVVITASHNPSQYNGYKVYGPDGCQITDQAAAQITGYIDRVSYEQLGWLSEPQARQRGLLETIPQSVFEDFIQKTLSRRVESLPATELNLVYTPLNGTGLVPVSEVFSRIGRGPPDRGGGPTPAGTALPHLPQAQSGAAGGLGPGHPNRQGAGRRPAHRHRSRLRPRGRGRPQRAGRL